MGSAALRTSIAVEITASSRSRLLGLTTTNDVHKATVCACISIKDAGVVEKHKRRFDTTTAQLRELVAWLQQHQVSRVAMEATSSIINTGAVVEHDCAIGECSHIAVRACIAGRSRLGDCVFLGAGAVVIDSISIASHVIIGAGGVVVAAIDSPGVYAGVPVRRIANRASVS